MALEWRTPVAALGQKLDWRLGGSLHFSDRCAYSIMHAGARPGCG
jgi:hypothetical protein